MRLGGCCSFIRVGIFGIKGTTTSEWEVLRGSNVFLLLLTGKSLVKHQGACWLKALGAVYLVLPGMVCSQLHSRVVFNCHLFLPYFLSRVIFFRYKL